MKRGKVSRSGPKSPPKCPRRNQSRCLSLFIAYRVAASLFCKSATVFNPFIYFFMSAGFRADCWLLTSRMLTCRWPLAAGDDVRLHGVDGCMHTDESTANGQGRRNSHYKADHGQGEPDRL